ncbi:MAG: hypothetical protein K9I68_00295 [Bacteroidales bacterium]|nr:hypothetical protein [Bacteroidales bacterium]MCF8336418.1 hypothetical protein [Bacteroidales bacterium]
MTNQNEQNEVPQCPQCGSTRQKKTTAAEHTIKFILGGLGLTGCGIWLLMFPIIGIPLIVIGAGAFLFGLISPFAGGTYECQDCKKLWSPKKSAK